MKMTPEERLRSKLTITDSCWIYTGALDGKGYGRFWLSGRTRQAHEAAYLLWVGPMPEGLVLDHLCRNHSCCRPDHLEPVTNRTNVLGGTGPTARNAAAEVCVAGHPFDAENTRWTKKGRECKECGRRRHREYYRRNKAAYLARQRERESAAA